MSKRRLVFFVFAALALSTAAYIHFQSTQANKPLVTNIAMRDSSPSESTADRDRGAQGLHVRSRSFAPDRPIPATMSPERAYADAYAILRCTHAADSSLKLPDDMTEAEKKQFEESRVAGLDCSALEGGYSAYELAKFAAEKGNVQAQLDFSAIAASVFNEEKNALDPNLIARYKSDSLKYLNMAADSGNADAFARLAESYRSGLFSDQDNMKAYAYAYANNQLKQSSFSKEWMERYSGGLSPDEVQRAQQLGQSLINRK